jgi:hypothetical protein
VRGEQSSDFFLLTGVPSQSIPDTFKQSVSYIRVFLAAYGSGGFFIFLRSKKIVKEHLCFSHRLLCRQLNPSASLPVSWNRTIYFSRTAYFPNRHGNRLEFSNASSNTKLFWYLD